MAQSVENLYSEIYGYAGRERLIEADSSTVHNRAGLDLIRAEIEQVMYDHQPRATLFVGAGKLSRLESDLERYRRLAGRAHGLFLFGESDVTLTEHPGISYVELRGALFENDYFCIAAGSSFMVALIAGAIPGKARQEALERYNALLTFNPRIVTHAVSALAMVMSVRRIEVPAIEPPEDETEAARQASLRTIVENRLAGRVSILSRQLHQNTLVDPMTGLYNHRHFYNTVIREVNRFNRTQHPFSVVYVEIQGEDPEKGDITARLMGEPVRAVAAAIGNALRKGIDMGFRIRSREFAAILEGAAGRDAARAALRLEENFNAREFPGVKLKIGVSECATSHAATSLRDHATRRLREDG